MISGTIKTGYDESPYPGYPYQATHPDRMATLATLFGLKPAPVNRCRVLEIGCGGGQNLIPMAYTLPQSEFIGIDLAGQPIAEGRGFVRKLGLKNVSLRHIDLMDFADPGPFDYIIAHGFYSWVPPHVQDRLMRIFSTVLAPEGIAFVSYNTYPGFYLRQMMREILLFHVDRAPDLNAKVRQARAFSRLMESALGETDELELFLKRGWQRLGRRQPGHLCHDELAAINRPLYFHEFMRHAASHGLQYLAESEYFMMFDDTLPESCRDALRALSDNRLLREQYLDFIRCQGFRQTLLCRQGLPLKISPPQGRMRELRASSSARPLFTSLNLGAENEVRFRAPNNAEMACRHPVEKATMLALITAWPHSLAFQELIAMIQPWLADLTIGEFEPIVEASLLSAYRRGAAELHTFEPHFSLTPGDRPVASPVARLQAEESEWITSLQHVAVYLAKKPERLLIPLMDGTRDRATLVRELRRFQGDDSNLDGFLEELGRLALLL